MQRQETHVVCALKGLRMVIMAMRLQVVNVLGFKLPFYSSPTLLLSLGLSVRVLYHLVTSRPSIIHVSSPGLLVFAATLYAKLLRIPLVVSYHTHIPEYIPKYTWKELVHPMWSIIRWCTRASDLTLVTSAAMKARGGALVTLSLPLTAPPLPHAERADKEPVPHQVDRCMAARRGHGSVQPPLQINGNAEQDDRRKPRLPTSCLCRTFGKW